LTWRQRGCRLDMGDQQVKGLVRVRLDQVELAEMWSRRFRCDCRSGAHTANIPERCSDGRIVVVAQRSLDLASIGARVKLIAAGRRLRSQEGSASLLASQQLTPAPPLLSGTQRWPDGYQFQQP